MGEWIEWVGWLVGGFESFDGLRGVSMAPRDEESDLLALLRMCCSA